MSDDTPSPRLVENPWLENKHWRNNRIRSTARGQLWGLGATALAVTGVAVFLGVSLLPRLLAGKEDAPAWLAMLFPVLAVWLIIAFLRRVLAWRRVGPVELELDPFPGSVDGQVGGTFWVDTMVDDGTPFEVSLDCMYRYVERRNKERVRTARSIWHAAGPGMLVTTGTSAAVQFRFDVPGELPYSQEHLGDKEFHFWRVSLKGQAGGIKLDRQYSVPVFATGESSAIAYDTDAARTQRQTDSVTDIHAHLDDGQYDQTPLARHASIEKLRGTLEIKQGILRHRVLAGVALVFAIVPGLLAWQVWQPPGDGVIAAAFSLAALVPALISLTASAAVVFLLFNSLRTRIDRNGIASQRRVLGIKVRDRTLAADAITELTLHRSGSTGSGSRRVEHLDIRAVAANGDHVTLIEGIDHRQPAEALRKHLGGLLELQQVYRT